MPYAELLTDAEVAAGLERLSDWRREGKAIARTVTCRGFKGAIQVVNRVADLAVEANHHPDMAVHGYKHVTLTLSTHAAGGITRRDLELAARIDAAAADLAAPAERPEGAERGHD